MVITDPMFGRNVIVVIVKELYRFRGPIRLLVLLFQTTVATPAYFETLTYVLCLGAQA